MDGWIHNRSKYKSVIHLFWKDVWLLKEPLVGGGGEQRACLLPSLTTEAVEGSALAFEGVDHVHSRDRLPLGVLGVGNSIADNVLEEHLENTTSLFVDESRDAFYTSTTCQTADGRLGDTLDVITKNLAVTLGASLSKSLSSFATTGHDEVCVANAGPTTTAPFS